MLIGELVLSNQKKGRGLLHLESREKRKKDTPPPPSSRRARGISFSRLSTKGEKGGTSCGSSWSQGKKKAGEFHIRGGGKASPLNPRWAGWGEKGDQYPFPSLRKTEKKRRNCRLSNEVTPQNLTSMGHVSH